ncbi:MAG TPA: hypothetical protein VK425_10410 [Acidimicrobiales bacterium]|nr:hypothetical protein [Acidimicrobiales bacterium]
MSGPQREEMPGAAWLELLLGPKPAAWVRTAAASALLTSPVAIGALTGVGAAIFVAFRTLVAAQGHIGGFVVAGSLYVAPNHYTRGLPITAGTGYDGQFYYRLALGPLDWSREAFGIRFDTLGRLDRIAYPALAWALSAGQQAAVPVMMPLLNAAALGALAGTCAALAREAGRHPLWGLLAASFWGFLWTLSRDLTELVEATFLMAALLALRKSRPVLAGVLLAVAVLAREPALLLVGAIFVSRVLAQARARLAPAKLAARLDLLSGRLGPQDAAWAVPALAFVGWQLALRLRTGVFGVLTSGQNNTGLPLVGLARGFAHYVDRSPSTASLLWLGELAVLALMVTLATISLRSSRAAFHEQVAWAASLVLTTCLTKGIWLGDVGFRSLDDLFLFSAVLLLFSRLRLDLAGWVLAAVWGVVAIELILFI